MSLVFGHLVNELSVQSFLDHDAIKISRNEFNLFKKEYVFDKLKGIGLGEAFAKKFNINDRVLYMFSNEEDTIKHIENWYINK